MTSRCAREAVAYEVTEIQYEDVTAPAGGTAAHVTTNAQGQYSLTGLRSRTYTVTPPITTGCAPR